MGMGMVITTMATMVIQLMAMVMDWVTFMVMDTHISMVMDMAMDYMDIMGIMVRERLHLMQRLCQKQKQMLMLKQTLTRTMGTMAMV